MLLHSFTKRILSCEPLWLRPVQFLLLQTCLAGLRSVKHIQQGFAWDLMDAAASSSPGPTGCRAAEPGELDVPADADAPWVSARRC